jgi:hypothetical protein
MITDVSKNTNQMSSRARKGSPHYQVSRAVLKNRLAPRNLPSKWARRAREAEVTVNFHLLNCSS